MRCGSDGVGVCLLCVEICVQWVCVCMSVCVRAHVYMFVHVIVFVQMNDICSLWYTFKCPISFLSPCLFAVRKRPTLRRNSSEVYVDRGRKNLLAEYHNGS